MKAGVLLFPIVLCYYGMAQDNELPPPSSHPVPENTEGPIPEPRHEDSPLLSHYGRANQLRYLIEPDIDFGVVNQQINIGLAPTVGHKVWKGLYAGVGLVFIYSGTQNAALTEINGQLYSANAHNYTYGAGVYLQYNIFKGLYARARLDLLHRQLDDINEASVTINQTTGASAIKIPVIKTNVPDLPLSIGYNLLVKKKMFFPIQVAYNVFYPFLNKQYSVYPNGWIVTIGMVNIF